MQGIQTQHLSLKIYTSPSKRKHEYLTLAKHKIIFYIHILHFLQSSKLSSTTDFLSARVKVSQFRTIELFQHFQTKGMLAGTYETNDFILIPRVWIVLNILYHPIILLVIIIHIYQSQVRPTKITRRNNNILTKSL